MLTNLDNEVIFKKTFTDAIVFKAFVRDVLGLDLEFDKIETTERRECKKNHRCSMVKKCDRFGYIRDE